MGHLRLQFKLTFIRDVLATNPCDPSILDAHIHEKQRKLILEKSKINTEINKYLDAMQISKERGDTEVNLILNKLEDLVGYELSPDERAKVVAGNLEDLKETLSDIDMRGTTVFFVDKETSLPMIGDHMIYGFMKAAADSICDTGEKKRATIFGSKVYTMGMINRHVRCEEQFLLFDRDIKREADGSPAHIQRSLRAQTPQGPRIALVKSEVVPAGASISFTLKIHENSPLQLEHILAIFNEGEFFGIGQWRNAGFGMFKYEYMKA